MRILAVALVCTGLLWSVYRPLMADSHQERQGITATVIDSEENKAAGVATPYTVAGFRSARFGDNEVAVRKAILDDFALSSAAVERYQHSLHRTTVLKVDVEKLAPGDGPATVRYTLGHRSRTLIQVDVLWQTAATTKEIVEGIASTGSVLAAYFNGFSWVEGSVRQLSLLTGDTIVIYRAHDERSGAIRLMLSGIMVKEGIKEEERSTAENQVRLLQVEASDEEGQRGVYTVAAPLGEENTLALLLSYIADRNQPDIYQIPKGDF